MKKLTVQISDYENEALKLSRMDVNEWLLNAVKNKARQEKDKCKESSDWMQAAVSLSQDGGDISDEWAIFSKGIELGYFQIDNEEQHPIPPVV